MAEITLSKLIRKETRTVLEGLLSRVDEPLVIFDLNGAHLLGRNPAETGRDYEQRPLVYNGIMIGSTAGIKGSQWLPVLAGLIETLYRQEVEKRSLAGEVLEKYRELHLLYRLSERLIASPNTEKIAEMALNEICPLVKANGGLIALIHEGLENQVIIAQCGFPYELSTRNAGSTNLIEQVMRTGTGQLMNNVPAGDFFLNREEERISLLCAPLKVEDRTSGVIILAGDQNKSFQAGDLKLLNAIALQTAPAIEIAHLHQKDLENARLERDLQTAFQVQSSMLPNRTPDFKGWQLAAFWQPARIVSGDLYDFIPFSGGKLGLVVADVTDKGVPAALLMANARSVLRGAAANAGRSGLISPGKLLARVNNVLSEDMPMDMFVTCLLVIIDRRSGAIRYANAGHNPPYLCTAQKVVELRATGLPLGIFPNMIYEEKEAWLEPGDSLLLYSDGLTEAHDREGDMFGFPRLNEFLSTSSRSQLEGEKLIQFLMARLADFTGPGWEQEDDITMVAAKRLETDQG